jgi:hypothetical protein
MEHAPIPVRNCITIPAPVIIFTNFTTSFFPSVRKWKSRTTLGADKKWEFEIGEDVSMPSPMETSYIVESRTNVSFKAYYLNILFWGVVAICLPALTHPPVSTMTITLTSAHLPIPILECSSLIFTFSQYLYGRIPGSHFSGEYAICHSALMFTK